MNTNTYCYVENNQVLQGPILLPSSWKDVSNLYTITDNNILKELGWLPYEVVRINPDEPVFVSSTITVESDKVVETVVLRAKTPEEIQGDLEIENAAMWSRIRKHRDLKLKETDVWMLIDNWEKYTDEQKNKSREYRQALRDIPQTYSNPNDVIWPTYPE